MGLNAEAIAEAATHPTMRFVPLKESAARFASIAPKQRALGRGTDDPLINQMGALLLERSIVLPQRWRSLAASVDAPLTPGAPDCIGSRIRLLVTDMRAEWAELDRRVGSLEKVRAYLGHLPLGPRLTLCTRTELGSQGRVAPCVKNGEGPDEDLSCYRRLWLHWFASLRRAPA